MKGKMLKCMCVAGISGRVGPPHGSGRKKCQAGAMDQRLSGRAGESRFDPPAVCETYGPLWFRHTLMPHKTPWVCWVCVSCFINRDWGWWWRGRCRCSTSLWTETLRWRSVNDGSALTMNSLVFIALTAVFVCVQNQLILGVMGVDVHLDELKRLTPQYKVRSFTLRNLWLSPLSYLSSFVFMG